MPDKEKVLRGWDRCSKCLYPSMFDQQFKDCEYTMGMYCRKDKLISETVELLKEQEEEIENLKRTCQSMMEGVCLLKEQEAVVHPEPSCEMTYITDCCCDLCGVQLIREDIFCRCCGKRIVWEGR